MIDQKEKFLRAGLETEFVEDSLAGEAQHDPRAISRRQGPAFVQNLVAFVVDEAHCVKQC